MKRQTTHIRLIRVSETTHARHDTENVVVGSVDTHLRRRGTSDRGVRQDQLQGSIVNAREVACARRLVLLRAKSERVHVNAGVRGAGVRLEGLDQVEVAALTLRETILTVELEFRSDHRVVAPAVEVERRLGEHEGASIRDRRLVLGTKGAIEVDGIVRHVGAEVDRRPCVGRRGVVSARRLEQTIGRDEGKVVAAGNTAHIGNRVGAAESVDGIRERINSIRVVERLGAKHTAETLAVGERTAVVDVLVRLDYPDQLLYGVVEVQLDLVGRGTDRLIARELELLDEVLVGVLGHAPALVRVKEHVVNEERGGNERLVVRRGDLDTGVVKRADRPEALINRAKIDVDADLVVLKSNQRERQTRVLAEPELQRDVQGRLGEGVTRSAHLLGGVGLARAIHLREVRVRDVSELSRVANHGVVTLHQARRHGELVPDVHPVAVVAINALATNLDLHLRDELLTGVIKPPGKHIAGSVAKILTDLGEGHLEHGAVRKIAISRDGAGDTPTEVRLAVEGLLNGLHRKVRVSPVGHLPVRDLRVAGKIYILGAISYELHQTTSHAILLLKKKIICIFE